MVCSKCHGSGRVLTYLDEGYETTESVCTECFGEEQCDGCLGRFERGTLHDVDGEGYCDVCAAGLVTLSMQSLGMLPRIHDTIPCGVES